MAVSKRLRYEILRRDNHTCRYCGGRAPDVTLTIDHVIPTTLGGTDDPSNLVTACTDCNSGKSATNPDAPLVDDVAADALRWANAMRVAAATQVEQLEVAAAWHQAFDAKWTYWNTEGGEVDRPEAWRTTIDKFREAGLLEPVLHDAVRIAMETHGLPNTNVWRYFCGVAWRRVEQLRADALTAVRDSDPANAPITAQETSRAEWLGVLREATLAIQAALDTGRTARIRDISSYLLDVADYGVVCGHPELDQCTDRCEQLWAIMAAIRPEVSKHLAALRYQPVGWPHMTTGRCA